nr:methionyl-tRNA synthetase [Polyrhizophydium stewartii]
MAAGLPLPRRIVSHGHWLVGQKKMSKSTGNVVDPHALLAKWGVDPVRYFLMRDGGIAIDPEFSHESVLRRYKHDLGAQLGNLVMRCCSATINKTGQIPAAIGAPLTPDAIELVELVAEAPERIDAEIAVGHLPAALERVEDLIVRLNKYWTDAKPWQLASQQGDAQAKLQSVLFVTYETLRVCALLLQPVMPHKMSLLLDTLDVDAGERTWANARIGKRWARLADGAAPPRQAAVPPKPSPLFPRIDA